ncbi:MAG TPA: hypothetical protein VL334_15355 [Anaerolineae bacterium]|nr:hypothetical protein [Anaerolineae bacterium]
MSNLWWSETHSEIGRLRVQGRHKDSPALRMALSRLLAGADLRPPGLSPQAVLIVRSLADPQPGRMAAGLRAGRVQAAWERAAQQRLADLQRRAARPALGPAPPDAEAVLFADESELLACLARDVSHGVAGQRWWWRAWLRSAGRSGWWSGNDGWAACLVQQLVQRPHLTPAVLAHLHRWEDAVALLNLLTPAQARAVLHAMLQGRGLAGLPGDPSLPIGSSPPPPWLTVASLSTASARDLGRERQALLGLALDLAARPQMVASAGYQRRLYAWWQAAGQESASSATGVGVQDGPGAPTLAGDAGAHANEMAALGKVAIPGDDADLGVVAAARLEQPAIPGTAVTSAAPKGAGFAQPAVGDSHLQVQEPGMARSSKPADLGSDAAFGPFEAAASAEPAIASPLWPADGVPTRLGGVLYLVNLMAALDLPACCERGWRLASGVGPWGLLHALGWELLGQEAVAGDALWPALALLDGRPAHEAPGWRLPRSRPRRWPAFELPAGWFKDLGFDTAQTPTQPTGFDTAQTPTQPTASAHYLRWQAAGLGQSYRPLLARWLALALPFIDLRLRLALGLPAEASPAAALLALPGQLYVTATHVDLVASLEHISLPARLAGLDRNPGWLPDFGRVVTFHFT